MAWNEKIRSQEEMREEMSKEFFYLKIDSKENKERMKIRGSLNKDKDTWEKALEAASSDIVSGKKRNPAFWYFQVSNSKNEYYLWVDVKKKEIAEQRNSNKCNKGSNPGFLYKRKAHSLDTTKPLGTGDKTGSLYP